MDGLFLYLYSMKIVVITAAYKREQLTELFYQSLNNQGLDIYCAVSNDVDEALAQKYCKGVVRCANNPVSDKFNKACDLLRGVNFDYAMVLGSDDDVSHARSFRTSDELVRIKLGGVELPRVLLVFRNRDLASSHHPFGAIGQFPSIVLATNN